MISRNKRNKKLRCLAGVGGGCKRRGWTALSEGGRRLGRVAVSWEPGVEGVCNVTEFAQRFLSRVCLNSSSRRSSGTGFLIRQVSGRPVLLVALCLDNPCTERMDTVQIPGTIPAAYLHPSVASQSLQDQGPSSLPVSSTLHYLSTPSYRLLCCLQSPRPTFHGWFSCLFQNSGKCPFFRKVTAYLWSPSLVAKALNSPFLATASLWL